MQGAIASTFDLLPPTYLPPAPMSDSMLNVAAYQFVELSDLAARRGRLKARCDALGLKGTILLSPEGINLFLAGQQASVEALLDELAGWPELGPLDVKRSYSDRQPFRRMNVRLKREIIAFGREEVDPQNAATPRLAPKELKQWLDEGRPVILLDVRNRYEIELGKFAGAIDLEIDSFRTFPEAIDTLPRSARTTPVVTYCTGGIRCEKAAPLLEQRGFKEVYQLDGGVLRYFEECGGVHWLGECFVFDHRVAVDSQLRETPTELCFACQATLSPDEQASPLYVPGESCPYCATREAEPDAHASGS